MDQSTAAGQAAPAETMTAGDWLSLIFLGLLIIGCLAGFIWAACQRCRDARKENFRKLDN